MQAQSHQWLLLMATLSMLILVDWALRHNMPSLINSFSIKVLMAIDIWNLQSLHISSSSNGSFYFTISRFCCFFLKCILGITCTLSLQPFPLKYRLWSRFQTVYWCFCDNFLIPSSMGLLQEGNKYNLGTILNISLSWKQWIMEPLYTLSTI